MLVHGTNLFLEVSLDVVGGAMERLKPGDVLKKVEQCENFEVKGYEGELVLIDSVHGIRKGIGEEELKLARRHRGRRRISKAQLDLVVKIVERLINSRRNFKVVFGTNDVVIRFDIDHYIHVYPGEIKVIGFENLEQEPLNLIKDVLTGYGTVKILRPVR